MTSETHVEEEEESDCDWGARPTVTGKVAFELRLKGVLGDKGRRSWGSVVKGPPS